MSILHSVAFSPNYSVLFCFAVVSVRLLLHPVFKGALFKPIYLGIFGGFQMMCVWMHVGNIPCVNGNSEGNSKERGKRDLTEKCKRNRPVRRAPVDM